jgi:four helix bundle protein
MENGGLKVEGEDNEIVRLSFAFAVRIVKLRQYLTKKKEYTLSDQLLRSGTSIGANVIEAQDAQSKKDFISKMSVALKEANETRYWIHLLIETDYMDAKSDNVISLLHDLESIIKLLVSIVKSSKTGQE